MKIDVFAKHLLTLKKKMARLSKNPHIILKGKCLVIIPAQTGLVNAAKKLGFTTVKNGVVFPISSESDFIRVGNQLSQLDKALITILKKS